MAEQPSVWRAEYYDPNVGMWRFWGWLDKAYDKLNERMVAVPPDWKWRFVEYRRVEQETER